ncbi:MAG: aminotransferase class III-fold pyridoxal phosphate-dependent enzyme [Deltaproteobacteria bacterium]|nr:aminotransferase class III-fold pyridoxal phosphate-dependent enzyme [Deltaproteobacteria bacterium]
MARDIEKLNAEKLPKSGEILERARKVLLSPQVTGPFRAPSSVAFVKEARGSRIVDFDGNEYVDVTMAYGPLILGHSHPVVVEAVERAVRNGTVYAIAHEKEVRWAEVMVDAIPCAERVAFTNSGTEATMHAIKVARARSGKDKIAKFEGGYHGVHDYAMVSSILATQMGPIEDPQSVPDTPGIPQACVDQVLTLSYRQPESFDKIRKHSDELAAVMIEPVPSSFPVEMGDFLRELREVTRDCGVLLIFDEVISGFRLSYGGAQERFSITPDIATYGKIMGGGFPAGAIAGSFDALAPLITSGDALQDLQEKILIIGTFSGNPVTASAGTATLEYLRNHPEVYAHIDRLASRIKREVHTFCEKQGLAFRLIGVGSWFLPHFVEGEPTNARDLRGLDNLLRGEILGNYMRYHGVYMPDLHTVFMSAVHTDEDADGIIEAFETSLLEMREDGLL